MTVPAPPIAVTRLGYVHGKITPRVILLHSTESNDRLGTSDCTGVLDFLRGTPDQLNVHYVADGEGNIARGARDTDLCYHAKGANRFSIGIEQIGHASWTTHQWLFDPSGKARPQLHQVAHLIAYLCDRHNIPMRMSTEHGVACHRDFPAGGHTDPGKGYPIGHVMRMATSIRAAALGAAA